KTDVNVFVYTLEDGSRATVSVGHPVPQNGPDLPAAPDTVEKLGLTAEQLTLLQLWGDGFSDAQLANLFGADLGSLRGHFTQVLQTLNVKSRTEACVVALKAGVVV